MESLPFDLAPETCYIVESQEQGSTVEEIESAYKAHNELVALSARIAALEARLEEAREVARDVVNNMPEQEIELARPAWGNTNTSIIKSAIARAAAWLREASA